MLVCNCRYEKNRPLASVIKTSLVLANYCIVSFFACAYAQIENSSASIPPSTTSTSDLIGPPDVYARLAQLYEEVKQVKTCLNPKSPEILPTLQVSSAEPREVYFQALTLHKKMNRLSFEVARVYSDPPLAPQTIPEPKDVYAVIESVFPQLASVKAELDLTEQVESLSRNPTKTPTDVYNLLLTINRELNAMIEQKFSPSDVFQQVTLIISYAERLRAEYPGQRIPVPPAFEPGKQPSDVFDRLLICFNLLHNIRVESGNTILHLEVQKNDPRDIMPSDVYDLASLVLSEVAYLHNAQSTEILHSFAYNPGEKTPAQVYQRVGILEIMLRDLNQLSRAEIQ